MPHGVWYDPTTRDFGVTGSAYDASDPVDQQVELALTIERGALKSAPEVGARFRQIKRLDPATIQNTCADMANEALADLLTAKKIKVLDVYAAIVNRQLRIVVTYQNLTTGAVRPVSV